MASRNSINILIVTKCDVEADFIKNLLVRGLNEIVPTIDRALSLEDAPIRDALGSYDFFLVDYSPGGYELLQKVRAKNAAAFVFLLLDQPDETIAKKIRKDDAAAVLLKGSLYPELLSLSARYALQRHENIRLHAEYMQSSQSLQATFRCFYNDEIVACLSYWDQLTGLYNRAFFLEELRRLDTKRQLPINLIMCDINGLKLVNDAFGYGEGDRLLVAFARLLKDSCRNEDIIARWGGDEFVVLLPGCPNNAAEMIVQRINNLCKNVPETPIKLFVSLGRAAKENISQDILEVLKKAESRMHRQKLSSSGEFCKAVITSLVKMLGKKDYETEAHSWRMQKMAIELGSKLGLGDSKLDELVMTVTLHDIGKFAVPEHILMKKERLTSEEWEIIKEHSERGYRVALCSSELAHIAPFILSHHEHWDGRGYPQGLKQEEIPLVSRIVCIADAYDVMSYGRPYKKSLSRAQVLEELKRCAGSQFDPRLVRLFIAALAEN